MLKWSLQQLNVLKHKGISIDDTVDVSDLPNVNREIKKISTVHVKGNASFSSYAVTFILQIEGEMILTCSRTLADVPYPFSIETMEIFKLTDWEGFSSEDDIHEPEKDSVDLLPYIKQAILLEIPIQVFSEDLEGEAPQSGSDWELLTEENKKQRIDPRLADLAKFFDDK